MYENINTPKPRVYRFEIQDRHAYDILVIYPISETAASDYDMPIGTLRFEKGNEKEQGEKEWWISTLNRLTKEELEATLKSIGKLS